MLGMVVVTIVITRQQLVDEVSCADELAAFDRIYPTGEIRLDGGWTRDAQIHILRATPELAWLWQTHLPSWSMDGVDLRGADLSYANLSRASLYRARLDGATLTRALLDGAYMGWAGLRNADLSRANLCGAMLTNSDLDDADLRGARLHGADASGAHLHGALRHPTDPDIPGWSVVNGRLVRS